MYITGKLTKARDGEYELAMTTPYRARISLWRRIFAMSASCKKFCPWSVLYRRHTSTCMETTNITNKRVMCQGNSKQSRQDLAQKTAVETCNHTLLPSGFVQSAWHTLPTYGPSVMVPVTAMSFIWIIGMCLILHVSTSPLRSYFCNKFRTMYYTRTFTMQSLVDQNNSSIFFSHFNHPSKNSLIIHQLY